MNAYAIMTNTMLQIGDQFDHYQIQAHMAQGGMSDVYRAFDLMHRREVVIKVPDHSMIGDPAQFERFQRELEVMKLLNHPAILKGLDSGKYNRVPYLVTEFVHGESLRTLMEKNGSFPTEQVVALIQKLANGMAYCHKNEVIHRDLKPENILITSDGQPIIMDFGLALTKDSHRVTYSNLSATMGTPDYMSPEQIEGQRGDQRTDIYALGTIMYEMLAGHTPFTGDTPMAVMAQHLNNTAPRLDKVNPSISAQVAAIVATCLARNPENRYPNMDTLIAALENPEAINISILDQSSTPTKPSSNLSLTAQQTIRGVAIAVGIIIVLVLLSLGLQTLRP